MTLKYLVAKNILFPSHKVTAYLSLVHDNCSANCCTVQLSGARFLHMLKKHCLVAKVSFGQQNGRKLASGQLLISSSETALCLINKRSKVLAKKLCKKY